MGKLDDIIKNIISYQKILGYYDNGRIPKSSNPIRKNGIIFYAHGCQKEQCQKS